MAIGKRVNVVNGQVEEFEYEPPVLAPEPEKSYAELRAAEYPPITDYIDGIVKGDTAQVQAYIDACLAVKAKYPKPLIEESTDELSS